jgi:phosphatidate phosphatase APP1
MSRDLPILLSFQALAGTSGVLITGQLSYSSLRDLSFKAFSRRRTFRTILALYRTRHFAQKPIALIFGETSVIQTTTDSSGAFSLVAEMPGSPATLTGIRLGDGQWVRLAPDMYSLEVKTPPAPVIVISDIDDTLLHSNISNRLLKLRTLMLTTLEKRKAVEPMREVLCDFHDRGATTFYLSNSEQNLYPLIYRFLDHNAFPKGALFLRQMRRFWDVMKKKKVAERDVHKLTWLGKLLKLFPDRRFILLGDNTQNDLSIYLKTAVQFPQQVESIYIRKVVERPIHKKLIEEYKPQLPATLNIYYDARFKIKSLDPDAGG